MKIETKFDIGQNVYIIKTKKESGYKVVKTTVRSYNISIDKNNKMRIYYFLTNGDFFLDNNLFATKQDAQEKIDKMI